MALEDSGQSRDQGETIVPRFRKVVYHSSDVQLDDCLDLLQENGMTLRQADSFREISPEAGTLNVILMGKRLITPSEIVHLEKLFLRTSPLAIWCVTDSKGEFSPDEPFAGMISGALPQPFSRATLLLGLQGAFRHAATRFSAHRERIQRKLISRNLENLTQIGIALSAEQNHHRLLDLILTRSRELTNADAGSLYLVEEESDGTKNLRFKHTQNDSKQIPFQEFVMPATKTSIAGYVAVMGEAVNIPDVYKLSPDLEYGFNRTFDESVGYRSKSMLVVPMRDHKNEITGVLQLINAKRSPQVILEDPEIAEREVTPFDPALEEIISALASQAAVSIENSMLLESIERTFEGLVKASVHAIEQRDPTTSGHSERVTELTCALAQAVSETQEGRYRDVSFTEEQMKELRYAGLLHDFGKIGVREHVLVKANKLYPMEMEVVKSRFALIKRTIESEYREKMLACALDGNHEEIEVFRKELAERLAELDAQQELVLQTDIPTMMPEGSFEELEKLNILSFPSSDGTSHPYITDHELECLSVRRGNLTNEERKEIESHVSHSYNFLVQIPWTRELRGIPEIAHGHHEKLNGAGYPLGLKEEQIILQAKMMCVCDIFDALTATDRPYKKAADLERAIQILKFEVKDQHLDPELVDIFIEKKAYQAVERFRNAEYQEPDS